MRFFSKTMLWLTIVPVMILVMAFGATAGDGSESASGVINSSVDMAAHQSAMQAAAPSKEKASEPTVEEVPPSPPPADPYKGWENWCEPIDHERTCQEDKDCKGLQHVARRPLKCVRPRNSKSDEYKVCAPGFSGPVERRWRRTRLREIVGQQYFDEAEHCPDWSWDLSMTKKGNPHKYERAWENGKSTARQFYKCGIESKKAEELTTFLWLIYNRETTARPWKRHRLNRDKAANERAYVKHAHHYGWAVETECINPKKKKCKKNEKMITSVHRDPDAEAHNPYYDNRFRFQFGLGGIGQNTALWLRFWDAMAPPEVLCLEPIQFEVYLRNARDIVRKLESGIDCDGDGKKELWNKSPTWAVIHRGASGGKVCPPKTLAKKKKMEEYARKFAARAKRLGLDLEKPVTVEMLGKPISEDGQIERAGELITILEEKLPPPFNIQTSEGQ